MSRQSEVIVECAENCGNSPKKLLLRDLATAFVNQDFHFCLQWIRDDLVWDIVGDRLFEGKDGFEQIANQMQNLQAEVLQIEHIITHGNTASLNGTLTCRDKKVIAFCHVYQFGSFGKAAKIKTITSYMIHPSI